MKQISTPITFFGSGPVAATSLALLAENFVVEAVITKPRAAKHHGSVPVLELCQVLGLKTFTPTNKQELSALFATKPTNNTIAVVIDYGIIIAQDVIDYFSFGIVNSHFSLLPQWRGADPITFSILSGQEITGVSLMLISAGLDEGPLLAQKEYKLNGNETTPELTEGLIELSDELLKATLPKWLDREITAEPQEKITISSQKTPTYSRKLTKADGRIDWQKPAAEVEREVRAFVEWPKSYTTLAGLDVVITQVHSEDSTLRPELLSNELGVPFITNDKMIAVPTSHGLVIIEKLKPAGKNEMTSESFLAGYSRLFS